MESNQKSVVFHALALTTVQFARTNFKFVVDDAIACPTIIGREKMYLPQSLGPLSRILHCGRRRRMDRKVRTGPTGFN